MSDDEGSWKDWAWNALWNNGLLLGVTFVSIAVFRNWQKKRRSLITSVTFGKGGGHGKASRPTTECLQSAFRAEISAMKTWLAADNSMIQCIVGARGSGRSALAELVLDKYAGTVCRVDLWAMPIESLSSWIPRMSEASGAILDWSIFRSAFTQLMGLLRGNDLDAQELDQRTELSMLEGLEAVIRFREALQGVEQDFVEWKHQSNGPAVLYVSFLFSSLL